MQNSKQKTLFINLFLIYKLYYYFIIILSWANLNHIGLCGFNVIIMGKTLGHVSETTAAVFNVKNRFTLGQNHLE